MCVIRVCNLPLADDSIGADVFSNTDNSGDGLDDTSTWFCPRHHCISCHALQTTECSLAAIVLPIQYYSNNTQFHRSCNYVSTEIVHNKDSPGKNGLTKSGDKGVGRKPKRPLSISNSEEDLLDSQNSGTVSSSTTKASASPPKSKKRGRPAFKTKDVDFVSPDNVLDSSESASISHENCTQRPLSLYRNLIQKDLKQCSTCPFSICRECERDLSPHTQLIAERRYIVVSLRYHFLCLPTHYRNVDLSHCYCKVNLCFS